MRALVSWFTKSTTSASTDCDELNNSACLRAQRSFKSPKASHFSPFWPGRNTSRSLVRIKSGRIGKEKSARPDSSKSTDRPMSTAQSAPEFCSSRISSMHCRSSTGSLTRETRVPSKSMLRSRMFIVDLRLIRLPPGARVRGERNEIRLRTSDGAAAKSFAKRHAKRRSEKTNRRNRFTVPGEDRGEGSFFERPDSQGAERREIRRCRSARETALGRDSTAARRVRGQKGEVARELRKIGRGGSPNRPRAIEVNRPYLRWLRV